MNRRAFGLAVKQGGLNRAIKLRRYSHTYTPSRETFFYPGVSHNFFDIVFLNLLICTVFQKNLKKMSEIAEKVKAIIIDKLGVEESEVTPEASFTNDLGADSLDTVELIMEFEKEFNVSIPDDQAENIGTVGQAISYLEEHAK
jgi:acyl carrier protein